MRANTVPLTVLGAQRGFNEYVLNSSRQMQRKNGLLSGHCDGTDPSCGDTCADSTV